MPASYSIDTERGMVVTRGWAVVGDDDLLDYYLRLAADPDFDPAYDQLGDLSEVSRVDITTEGIREAARLSVFHRSARRAFVAPSDLVFGMARMFEIISDMEGQNVRVFRSRDDALRWLDRGEAS